MELENFSEKWNWSTTQIETAVATRSKKGKTFRGVLKKLCGNQSAIFGNSSVGYSVPFVEGEKALNDCVTEMSSILAAFTGDVSEGSFAKRNKHLLTLIELKSDFEYKVKEWKRSSLRAVSFSPKKVVSDENVSSADALSDSEEESAPSEPNVAKWN
ncbi:hypothetical protein FQA39_LY14056 [Lamprigera yunnana]|nr:hypothetical protein FQA39_LY14056 [Lamprigera yunnana]